MMPIVIHHTQRPLRQGVKIIDLKASTHTFKLVERLLYRRRTRDCFDQFVDVLSRVDVLILLDVYAAGEPAIPRADSKTLSRSIRSRGEIDPIYLTTAADLKQVLSKQLVTHDVFIMQGAGNIGAIAQGLIEEEFRFLCSEHV